MAHFIQSLAEQQLDEEQWFKELRELTDSTDEEDVPLYRKLSKALYSLLSSSSSKETAAPAKETVAQPKAAAAQAKGQPIQGTKRKEEAEKEIPPVKKAKQPLSNETQSRLDSALDAMVSQNSTPKVRPTAAPRVGKKATKCLYFPNCRFGEACEYTHPTEPCQKFPHCPFGDSCIYIHPSSTSSSDTATTVTKDSILTSSNATPACGYGLACTNAACPYVHPKEMAIGSVATSAPAKPSILRSKQAEAKPQITSVPAVKGKPVAEQTCRFGEICQQRGCPLHHPPSRKATEAPLGGPVPPLSFHLCER